jgi:hypothetical protein
VTTTEQPETNESTATTPAASEASESTATPTASATDSILSKAPTALHRRYTKYIAEKFGFLLDGAEVPEDFFEEGNPAWEQMVKLVQIAVVRYGEYQKSPQNAELKALLADRAEKQAAAAKAEKEKAAAEKAAAKATEKAASSTDDAPKAKATKTPAKAAKGGTAEAPF